MGLEFGECVMWRRRPVGSNLAKLAVLWDVGVYLGVMGSTGEIIIGNGDGVWRTRTVRRRPEELRWRAEKIEKIKELPWDHEGENKEGEVVRLERLLEELMKQEKQAIKEELKQPYAFHTKREDYEKYGCSRGCPMLGLANGHHQAEAHAAVQAEDGEGDGRIGEGEECKATKRGVVREGHRRTARSPTRTALRRHQKTTTSRSMTMR